MLRLFKKCTVWSGAIAGILLILVCGIFGEDVVSYARVAKSRIRDAMAPAETIDGKLQRAEELIADLEPHESALVSAIARDEILLVQLRRDITKQKGHLLEQQEELARFGTHSDAAEADSSSEIDSKARRKKRKAMVRSIAAATESIKAQQDLLDSREASFALSLESLESVRVKKLRLESLLVRLQAKHRDVHRSSENQRSRDVASAADELLKDIRHELDVAQRYQEMEAAVFGGNEPSSEAHAELQQ